MYRWKWIVTGIALVWPVQAALAGPPDFSVEYTLSFDATWSPATHPGAFPDGAHFSALAGAVHAGSVSFFNAGGLATPGLERLAETGSRSVFTNEVRAAIEAGAALALVSGGAVSAPPAAVTTTFTVSAEFPLVTVIAAIGPSPDWFVGVSALSLLEGGEWVDELTIPLLPYDAGTDSGVDFTSADRDTNPAQPVRLLDTGPLAGVAPLGTFTFLLAGIAPQRPEFVRGDADQDGRLTIADPVAVLLFLFAGSEAPSCLDAADVLDSGRLNVASAVAVLNHLFLGGPPPPPPYPACGRDPSPADSLDCADPVCP